MSSNPIQFDDLLKIVEQLSPEQKRIIRLALDNELPVETLNQSPEQELPPRIPDLHAGAIWTSDDFDDPLPDEFWLGDDA